MTGVIIEGLQKAVTIVSVDVVVCVRVAVQGGVVFLSIRKILRV